MRESLQKLKTRYAVLFLIVTLVILVLFAWKQHPRNSSHRRENENKQRSPPCNFDDVRYFVLFVGTGRSGHTLVSALLDAHPHVLIADEYNLLQKWPEMKARERTRDRIFKELYEKSRNDSLRGRSSATNEKRLYTYHVPEEFAGECVGGYVNVIGDKKGTGSALFLRDQNNLNEVGKLQEVVGVPIKIFHVVRNPYDTISTMTLRHEKSYGKVKKLGKAVELSYESLSKRINEYFEMVDAYESLVRADLPNVEFKDVWSDDVIRDPKSVLRDLCAWLEIKCANSYVRHCASIVARVPSKTRELIEWPSKQKEDVKEAMKKYSFFNRYSFSN